MSKKDATKNKLLMLVDGSSYLYRAYHAMPQFTNSRGDPTGAVYGTTHMLRKLLADYDPAYVAVVFDAKGKTFRDELFPEYKANRPPMPDELRAQVKPIHDIVRAMGLPLLIVEGVEADDVIGTVAAQAPDAGLDTLISTGDKDMAQLVNEHVTLINTMNDARLDSAGVKQKFGVPPERIIDYLALIGDTVDNIPGVPKVGPKTAAKWLQEYGSLDEIIANADAVGGKIGENLRASLEQLPLSRRLATIKCDVALDHKSADLERQPQGEAELRKIFAELEFKNWLAELGGAERPQTDTNAAGKYETLLDERDLDAWIDRLRASELFAIDTETTGLDAMTAELVGISFTDTVGSGAYVPFGHVYPGVPQQLDRELVLNKL